jgi:NADH dehydrogenase [ubiquinone] 1 alpha subcomplex assembly factor 7
LKEYFLKKIKIQGPITVSDYMSDCLLAPKFGYYNKKNVIGAKGDFITSPEISQIFGELIGLSFVDYWYKSKKPKSPILVDIGGGNGTMMKDALRATEQVDKILIDKIKPIFIESSETLIKKQKNNIPKSQSFSDINKIPNGFLMIYANEFFDALPIHQFTKVNNNWHERLIDINSNNDLQFIYDKNPSPYEAILPEYLKNNEIIEFSPATINIISSIIKKILDQGGIFLIIDYALNKADVFGSLQAVKDHKYINPLSAPGKSDLSSKVNFNLIVKIAKELNANVHGPIKQKKFLKNLGIDMRCKQLIKRNPHKEKTILNDYYRLTSDKEMGNLFEVIAITSNKQVEPAGFNNG